MEIPKANLAVVFTIALIAMIVTALAASLLSTQRRIESSGNIKTLRIAVCSNPDCTENLTFINWGLVEAGRSQQRVIWIKNTGNTPAILNMTTESWNPTEAKNHIILTWNKEGFILSVGQSIEATLTLSVLTSVTQTNITEFSFTIVITGIEYSGY